MTIIDKKSMLVLVKIKNVWLVSAALIVVRSCMMKADKTDD